MPRALRRSLPVALLAVAMVLASSATAASAKGNGQPGHTRIVGGTESAEGAWPSQVALLIHGEADRFNAQFCGGTVLSPSWILTAGHCVDEGDGKTSPQDIDVLAGTQDLTVGGERVRVAEIRWAPGWNPYTLDNDLALLRLDRPVNAPAMPIVNQGRAIAPGTDLVTTGWGTIADQSSEFPTKLREVHVPYVSDSACRGAYSDQSAQYFTEAFCAGLLGVGGKDSCSGDSGGPISAKLGGVWTQIGIVSWGNGCADPDFPGFYTRLARYSDWLKNQIRFGPQPDVSSFVRQQYRDFTGKAPTTRQLFLDGLVVNANPLATYVASQVAGRTWQGSAGGVARLYQAYFQRDADQAGLDHWVKKIQGGSSLNAVSSSFAASSEFTATYGSLSNQQFVDLVYTNVLGRAGDVNGATFWTGQLDAGKRSRGQVMTGFSESNEFKAKTRARTNVTITYYALLRRVPTDAEYTAGIATPNLDLVRSILGSVAYANRF